MLNRRAHPLLQEEVWTAEAPGGGRVWVVPSAGQRCHAVLLVDFGSIDGASAGGSAVPLPEGTAHFLEHRLFEKPEGDIAERFTWLGAEVDAQTGLTGTSFSFTAGANGFDDGLPLLFELAGRGYFPEEGIRRERSIIVREIQLFDDSVEWVAFQTALRALYGAQRIAVDIAGTPESLDRIDAGILERCHQQYYHSGSLKLIVCGPVDGAAVCHRGVELMGEWPASPGFSDRGPRILARPSDLEVRRAVPKARRLLLFPDPVPARGRNLLRRELSLELALDILFGASSGFFERNYESGLIDGETFGGEVHLDGLYGFCLLGGDTDRPEALRAAVLEELETGLREGRIEAGFDRALRRVFGEMVCRWEDVEDCAEFVECAVRRGCHPFELVDLHLGDALDAATVQACASDCLSVDALATATVLPTD